MPILVSGLSPLCRRPSCAHLAWGFGAGFAGQPLIMRAAHPHSTDRAIDELLYESGGWGHDGSVVKRQVGTRR